MYWFIEGQTHFSNVSIITLMLKYISNCTSNHSNSRSLPSCMCNYVILFVCPSFCLFSRNSTFKNVTNPNIIKVAAKTPCITHPPN